MLVEESSELCFNVLVAKLGLDENQLRQPLDDVGRARVLVERTAHEDCVELSARTAEFVDRRDLRARGDVVEHDAERLITGKRVAGVHGPSYTRPRDAEVGRANVTALCGRAATRRSRDAADVEC